MLHPDKTLGIPCPSVVPGPTAVQLHVSQGHGSPIAGCIHTLLECLHCMPDMYSATLQTGKGVERGSRAASLPKRPEQGWSLVVRRKGRDGIAGSYVAHPNGTTREPDADENLLLMRATPKKRRAIQ